MTTTETAVVTQIHRIYIKASQQAIWDAITNAEWTQRYGYRGLAEYDLRPGGAYRFVANAEMQALGMPEVVVDGKVLEADPPRRLVQTWRFLWDEEIAAEGPIRIIYEIDEDDFGYTRLTVTTELENAPKSVSAFAGEGRLQQGGGGMNWILSELKTLLETGSLDQS